MDPEILLADIREATQRLRAHLERLRARPESPERTDRGERSAALARSHELRSRSVRLRESVFDLLHRSEELQRRSREMRRWTARHTPR